MTDRRKALGALCVLGGAMTFACAPPPETIRFTSEGKRAPMRLVDEDPFRLIAPGAIAWWRLASQSFFETKLGEAVLSDFEQKLQPAVDAGLKLGEQVELVVGALYASVGSDAVSVLQGQFDAEALRQGLAADKRVEATTFSGQELFLLGKFSFCVLSSKTAVVGTHLGVRRALERVEEGRMKRTTPKWFDALLKDDLAKFQFGMDLESQPVPAAFRGELPFLKNLRAARLLGNFKSPGVNVAGSLTYDTPSHADVAAAGMLSLQEDLGKYQLLLSALQLGRPLRELRAQATGKDMQVTAQLDGVTLAGIFENMTQFLGANGSEQWLPN